MKKRASARLAQLWRAVQIAALIALCMAAAAYTFLETSTTEMTAPAPAASVPEPLPNLTPRMIKMTEAAARPLFDASRRPWIAPPPPQAQPPEPSANVPLAVTLAGISQGPTGKKALLRSQSEPEGQWFAEGDEIAGWKLDQILADYVRLTRNGQVQALTLYPSSPE